MDNLTQLEKMYIISILGSLSEYEAYKLLEENYERFKKERTKEVLETTEEVNDFNLKVYEKLAYMWNIK